MQDIKSKKVNNSILNMCSSLYINYTLIKLFKKIFKQTHCCAGMMIKLMSIYILRKRQVYSLMLHLKSSFLENHT